jgi:hypothetical protein
MILSHSRLHPRWQLGLGMPSEAIRKRDQTRQRRRRADIWHLWFYCASQLWLCWLRIFDRTCKRSVIRVWWRNRLHRVLHPTKSDFPKTPVKRSVKLSLFSDVDG